MMDTRNKPTDQGGNSPASTRNYDEGMTYVWLSKSMSEENRQQLNRGMKRSEKGRQQRAAMQEVRQVFGEMTEGGTFRLPKDEYDQYMKDGEV